MNANTTRPTARATATVLTGALMVLGTLAGCETPQAIEERDRLYVQNQELEEELAAARSAYDALQAENERLRTQLAQQPDPAPQQQAQPRARAQDSGFADITGVETEDTAAGVAVRVPGDVLFAPGEAEVRDNARDTLQQIARVLEREYPDQIVRIEGYTDTDPIQHSPWTDNLELSLQRAAAVQRFLMDQGIRPDRMYAAGFGDTQPRATKEESRRVEIVVVQHE